MFDAVFVISLDRRPERLRKFYDRFPSRDWPWKLPALWPGVDGIEQDIPEWFHGAPGVWGCLQSHIELWTLQVCDELDSVLVFEDDAVLCRDGIKRMQDAIACVPDDWDQIYFGGQHMRTNRDETPPEAVVQDRLIRGRYINRTHAYAIRRPFAEAALEAIDRPLRTKDHRLEHVDYRLCELHASGRHNIYAPWRFCIGQMSGDSDVVSNRQGRPMHKREHWWNEFPIVEPAGVCCG